MKKLKIKKIDAWERNESIRKKKMLKKCCWDWEKKICEMEKKWEHNEMIIKKNMLKKNDWDWEKKICEMEKKMKA